MPEKANEIDQKIACPACGTTLLKSGYCPKCHRKKDGTLAERHGKHSVRDSAGKFKKKPSEDENEPSNSNAAPKPGGSINVADYSMRPDNGRDDVYLCEGCRAPVHYLQRKCKKCGIYLDWRGSPAESDDDAVICPMCGAFCGYTEDNPSVCPHCRYQG